MSGGVVVHDVSETSLHGTGGVALDEDDAKMPQDLILQNTRTVIQGLDQLKSEHNSILHRYVTFSCDILPCFLSFVFCFSVYSIDWYLDARIL